MRDDIYFASLIDGVDIFQVQFALDTEIAYWNQRITAEKLTPEEQLNTTRRIQKFEQFQSAANIRCNIALLTQIIAIGYVITNAFDRKLALVTFGNFLMRFMFLSMISQLIWNDYWSLIYLQRAQVCMRTGSPSFRTAFKTFLIDVARGILSCIAAFIVVWFIITIDEGASDTAID